MADKNAENFVALVWLAAYLILAGSFLWQVVSYAIQRAA